MINYIKAIIQIIKNYRSYSIVIIFFELLYFLKYSNKFNEFKYLKSKYLSDSLPCSFYTLKYIEKNILNLRIKRICDLGSGYGKILYYFGKIYKKNIHGVEIEKEIYFESRELVCKNIKIFNENILKFNLKQFKYDAFILNDPLKDKNDLMKLILNIKIVYDEVIIILINLDLKKQMIIEKELNILENFKVSTNKNIFFCKIK